MTHLDDLFAGLPAKLDVPAVADLLGMTTKGVYGWIHSGVIPAYKLGGSWLILRDELRDTIAAGANTRLPPGTDPDQSPTAGVTQPSAADNIVSIKVPGAD